MIQDRITLMRLLAFAIRQLGGELKIFDQDDVFYFKDDARLVSEYRPAEKCSVLWIEQKVGEEWKKI